MPKTTRQKFTVCALLASILFPTISLAVENFFDVPVDHPYNEAIHYVRHEGIVQGYPDGTYHADAEINRAEFTKIIMEATFPGASAGANCFSDVHDEWFSSFVCTAKAKGIIGGYPDGTFKPGANISYVEAAKIIVEAYDYPTTPGDVWYEPYVLALTERDAVPLTIQRNDQKITRGEMAEIIFRLRSEGGAPNPAALSFIVDASDETASPLQLSVPRGAEVTITFRVDTENVYYGGLEFRSPYGDTGSIPPGGEMEFTFTAEESFFFVPFWPSSDIQKPYMVEVQVEE
jgi:hypothetical protein